MENGLEDTQAEWRDLLGSLWSPPGENRLTWMTVMVAAQGEVERIGVVLNMEPKATCCGVDLRLEGKKENQEYLIHCGL